MFGFRGLDATTISISAVQQDHAIYFHCFNETAGSVSAALMRLREPLQKLLALIPFKYKKKQINIRVNNYKHIIWGFLKKKDGFRGLIESAEGRKVR
jgi:hypothetical protein